MKNYINRFQRDLEVNGDGSFTMTADPDHVMSIRHFRIAPIIGFGLWRDDYSKTMGPGSHCYNIILPFIRIQFGEIYRISPKQKMEEYGK